MKENECRAMSEFSKKRVRTSLKAIAQFKRACILFSSLSERCYRVKFFGGIFRFFSYVLCSTLLHLPSSDSTVSEDARIELLPWQSEALTSRLDLLHRTEELLTKKMIKDVFILVSVPMYECI